MTVEEKILKKELKKVRKELKLVTEELRSMNVTLQSVVCNQNYLYFKLDPEGKNIERMLNHDCHIPFLRRKRSLMHFSIICHYKTERGVNKLATH